MFLCYLQKVLADPQRLAELTGESPRRSLGNRRKKTIARAKGVGTLETMGLGKRVKDGEWLACVAIWPVWLVAGGSAGERGSLHGTFDVLFDSCRIHWHRSFPSDETLLQRFMVCVCVCLLCA